MNKLFIGLVIFASSLVSCANNQEQNEEADTVADSTIANTNTEPVKENSEIRTASINEIVSGYLQVKNALVKDDATDAATQAVALAGSLRAMDTTSFTAGQKKIYSEVNEDMNEHAEHISANAGKIAHQREHFDMLSKDVYDLVKQFNAKQTLYKDFCPMYNGKKGASWLSEKIEIENPYYGKEMLTCGSVKETIKGSN